MNKVALAAAAAALALPVAGHAQKLGSAVVMVVNTERLSRECTACVGAQAQMQQQAQQLRQRAQELGKSLEAEATALRTALGGKAPNAAQKARIDALTAKQTAAQQELANREQAFNRNRAYVGQQVNAKLMPIINQVMAAHNANIVMDSGATLAVSPALDVTNEVMAALNKQLPSVNVTAPAAAAAPTR